MGNEGYSEETRGAIQRDLSIAEEYFKMDSEDAVSEWMKVKEEGASLKKKLIDVTFKKDILELVPAVAEYRVENTLLAKSLLYEVYVKGGQRVREIYASGPDNTTKTLLEYSLSLLKNAGFVESDRYFRTSITNSGEAFCIKNWGEKEHDR